MLDVRSKAHALRIFPIGSPRGVKIDNQEAPKAAKDKVRRFFRGSFRMTDTITLLKSRRALTGQEERWLSNLKRNDRAAYNELEKLLTVPKYLGGPGQHGLLHREDRNNVRMQTLKAAVHEAVKAANSDRSETAEERQDKKKKAVARALDRARLVRRVLNQEKWGWKLRIYKLVTLDTLRDPHLLYDKNNRIVENELLSRTLSRPNGIHKDIKDAQSVAAAAQALVDHGLLDQKAARLLRTAFKKWPEEINKLMAVDQDLDGDKDWTMQQEADRQKVRSLLLLSLAYTSYDNAMLRSIDLRAMVYANEHLDAGDSGFHPTYHDIDTTYDYEIDDVVNNPGDPAVRQAHELLPDLRATGDALDKDREAWIAWAKQPAKRRVKSPKAAKPRAQSGSDDDIKKEKEIKKSDDIKEDIKKDHGSDIGDDFFEVSIGNNDVDDFGLDENINKLSLQIGDPNYTVPSFQANRKSKASIAQIDSDLVYRTSKTRTSIDDEIKYPDDREKRGKTRGSITDYENVRDSDGDNVKQQSPSQRTDSVRRKSTNTIEEEAPRKNKATGGDKG